MTQVRTCCVAHRNARGSDQASGIYAYSPIAEAGEFQYAFQHCGVSRICVDENGTEAAAVTAMLLALSEPDAAPPKPVSVVINRPFIFLIRDGETGAILFVGRMVDPTW